MGKKLSVAGGVGLAFLLVLSLALGFRGWDATEFASEALERFETEAGWKLEAESARLVPFRGLYLEGVSGTARIGAGTAEILVDRLQLEHRPAALLGGELELVRLVLVRPRVNLLEPAPPEPRQMTPPPPPKPPSEQPASPPPPPPEAEPEPEYDGPLRFRLRSVEIEGGALVVSQVGSETGLRIEGLQLSLEAPSIAPQERRSLAGALSSTGRFRAESVQLPVGQIQGLEGELSIAEGRLLLPNLAFSNGVGEFRADVELQLGSAPLRHVVTLRGDPIDLEALFDSPERGVFGKAQLDLRVAGSGTSREALTGRGSVSVSAGRLPSFPILNHLEAGLRRVSLHQAEHGPVLASFALAGTRLELEPFSFQAAELRFDGEGSIGLDGELALEITLSAQAGEVSLKGLPDELVQLMTVEGDRLSIPVLVTGTTERPRARADSERLAARARDRGQDLTAASLDAQLDELFGLEG